MPLALESLVFEVQTEKLLAAKKAIDDLSSAMQNLNKVQQEETKSAINAEKVKQDEAKTAQAVANAKIAETKAEKSLDSAKKSSLDTSKQNISILERQQTILDFMTQGFSKGQASVLAYAKTSGALTNELKQLEGVLQTQRKLMGGDPFDKSMSGLVSLNNQYGEIREAIRQYNNETTLTRNQTRELARDKERIIEKMKLEGATFSEIKQAVKNYNQAYTESATKVNSLTQVEKDRERIMRDTANATKNVQAAEERLFATVSHLNDAQGNNVKVNERAALAIGSYERNLRLAGITGEDAAKRLMKFKAAQEQVTAAEAKNRANYIARGIGVQMGDVGVSLASGMNPLTVAIQQGDQLRSIIQQSGLEATQMAGIMKQAFAGIITSFKDVGIAMGSFILGGLKTVGSSIYDFVTLPVKGLTDSFKLMLSAGSAAFSSLLSSAKSADIGPTIDGSTLAIRNYVDAIKMAGTAWLSAAKVVATVAAVMGGVLLVALGSVISASTEMNKKLLTQGALLGLSSEQAREMSKQFISLGVSLSSAMKAVGDFSNSGIQDQELLKSAIENAIELQQTLGISVEETAKKYSDISKKPVEVLIELAKNTGLVSAEVIKHVAKLEKQKKEQEAVKLAQNTYLAAMREMKDIVEENLTPIERLWKDIKKAINETLGAIQKTAEEIGVFTFLQKMLAGVAYGAKVVGNSISFIGLAIRSIKEGDISEVISFTANAMNQAKSDYMKALADIDAADAKFNAKSKKNAQDRQKNARDALDLDYLTKKPSRQKEDKTQTSLLNNDLNAVKRFVDEENKLYKNRLDAIEFYNKQGYLSIKEYYDAQVVAADENVASQRKAVDEQLKILSDYQSKAKSPKEQADAQGKINEQLDKRNVIESEYNKTLANISLNRDVSNKEWLKQVQDINAQVLTLQGNFVEADRIRSNLQYEELRKKALIEQNDLVLAQIDLIKQANAAQAARQEFVRGLTTKDPNTFTETDKQSEVANKLSSMGIENTQKQLDAQLMIYQQYYADLNLLKQKELISEDDYAKARAQVAKKEQETRYKSYDDFLSGLAGLQDSSIKEIALMGKAAAIAQAIINTYQGATKALAEGGLYGIATAAVVVANGMANVAKIRSQSTGYSEGGYTGPGGKYQPAGIVHKGEVVWSQEDVARAGGVNAVESMRKGVGGYADGGIVTYPSVVPTVNNNSTTINNTATQPAPTTKIINVLDPNVVGDYLATDDGERLIVNVMQRNQKALRG